MRMIKNSLSAKVFLWVLCALTLCSFFIYGLVMLIIPRQYTSLTNARVERAAMALAWELDNTQSASASQQIYDFCIENHTTALLITGDQMTAFGEASNTENENTASVSFALRFSDLSTDSVLTVITSASTAEEITATFLRLLPFAAVLILIISLFSAWFCGRLIVRPVLRISRVSKRMAQLDMTWHCETTRTDELGTLANSLNILSQRLSRAMDELKAANVQLRADVAASRALEKQRRDFFAAASHELKTPVTILKGQLESMALGIGDYKNHEKYFPQALATVEAMERLVQEILIIAKMEFGIAETDFVIRPIAPILSACIAELLPLAEEKQITIKVGKLDESVGIPIQEPLFRKAVSNILSNAVRHSPNGQLVTVTLTEDKLTVENTGVRISEDAPLFTPFYRADQSRNRKSGGSGLGLYLIKTILDWHGLAYRLENSENAVLFTLFLNQNKTE